MKEAIVYEADRGEERTDAGKRVGAIRDRCSTARSFVGSDVSPFDGGGPLAGTEELGSGGVGGVLGDEHPAEVLAEPGAVAECDLSGVIRAGAFAETAFVIPVAAGVDQDAFVRA